MIGFIAFTAAIVVTALLIWLVYSFNRYLDFKHNALFHPKFYRFNVRVFLPKLDRYLGWVHRDSEVKVKVN